MSSRSSASFALIAETCVRMCTQDHVTGAIENAIDVIGGAVIEYLIDGVIGSLRGSALL